MANFASKFFKKLKGGEYSKKAGPEKSAESKAAARAAAKRKHKQSSKKAATGYKLSF